MVRCFFLLIHFLVVEGYGSPKSTSDVVSLPLNLQCIRILSWSISFFSYFNCLPDYVLCKISIWTDDNALNSSCGKPSDLSLQVVTWSQNSEKAILEISEKAILHPILMFGKLFYIYKLIHIDLKRIILIASFF